MRHIPYSRQLITRDDIHEVSKVLKSDFLTQGKKIDEFEKKLAKYVDAKYAVVFNSATSALHAAYFSLGLTNGDEIITSPITFVATSNAALYLGAKPVFADVIASTGNIDAGKIDRLVNKKTKILVPVHYGGLPSDMKTISKIAKKYKLFIVEDASQAIGAKYYGSKIGSGKYSHISIFSFQAVKHITTGEGGAAVTNSRELYEKMLLFRTHGITKNKKLFVNAVQGDWYHEMHALGFNYRMTDFQAALGISQMKKLNKFLKKRQNIARIYDREFANSKFFNIMPVGPKNISTYHLYPIVLKENYVKYRKKIFDGFRKNGLGVQVHYIPVYLQPYYKSLGYKKGLCPNAEFFYNSEISIPLSPSMTSDDIKYVIHVLNKTFEKI